MVDRLATDYLETTRAPGLSIAFSYAKEPVVASGYGESDAGTRQPSIVDTAFRIGSITKQFTAAAILGAVAAGRLDIDEDAAAFFPRQGFPRKGISLRHLLSHTAGLSSLAERKFCADEAFAHGPENILAAPNDTEPGLKWKYCNAGFAIAARILEQITEEVYDKQLAPAVFESAGLKRTSVGPPSYGSLARGHRWSPAGFGYVSPVTRVASFGSGDIYSTAKDLVQWFAALSDGRVIPSELYSLMTTPFIMKSGEVASYGMGMFIGEFGENCELSQDGNIAGFSSQLACYPDHDLFVAVLTNGAPHDAEGLEKSITRTFLSVPDQVVLDLEVPSGDLEAYAGEYRLGAMPIRVWTDSGALFIAKPNGRTDRLLHQGSGIFAEAATLDVRIRFASRGAIVCRYGKTLARLERPPLGE